MIPAVGVYLDELDRVLGGERLLTLPIRQLEDSRYGGEWDWRRLMPRRTHRRLAGAGWLSSTGISPDELEMLVVPQVAGVETLSEAVEWYLKMASRAIGEARREQHQRRHLRFAKQQGHASYYAYRRAVALEAGHGSFWHMRQDRGWQ